MWIKYTSCAVCVMIVIALLWLFQIVAADVDVPHLVSNTPWIHTKLAKRPKDSALHTVRTFDDVIFPDMFRLLRAQVSAVEPMSIRSYIPTHKQGNTVGAWELYRMTSPFIQFYHSEELSSFVSNAIGVRVRPIPIAHPNSCAILIYKDEGDFIHWHFDHNYYQGRTFTVLLTLENLDRNREGPSNNMNCHMIDDVQEVCSDTRPNQMIIFEGQHVLHRTKKLRKGERRVVLSMLFCSDARQRRVFQFIRRLKDIAFFGIRALGL
jgi:2OG-Fe(II) oxygenase superfamily